MTGTSESTNEITRISQTSAAQINRWAIGEIKAMSIARKAYSATTARLLALARTSWIEKFSDELLRLRFRTQEILRQRAARNSTNSLPSIRSALSGEVLARSILEQRNPWDDIKIAECGIPGMLTDSERRYYSYITQFYSGSGAVVELGPWLGLSTYYIISSLIANPHFNSKRLHVYDDFTWRSSWMNKWLAGTDIRPLANHSSFQDLFRAQLADFDNHLIVKRQKISDYDGNEHLPLVEWDDDEIELLVVDCGRTLAVNEGWWSAFSSSFVPNRTMIVMQDWQNHKRVPEVFWENTKMFTDGKGDELDLVHEVRNAGIATFLYRGKRNA